MKAGPPLRTGRAGGPAGPLPSFILIGATKCGTTSLHSYLSRHPDVFMHPQKELRFFTAEHNYARGLDWYRAQFEGAEGHAAVGEASNAYSRHPVYSGVPRRIAAALPDVRLVYVIRDPMRRIESHYRHRLVTGREWRDADTAITQDPSYLAASLYGHQIERYLEYFDRGQMLALHAERLFSHPDEALAELCGFIGVRFDAGQPFRIENETASRQVAPVVLRRLYGLSRSERMVDLAARLSRSGLRRGAPSAQTPPFKLSDGRRAELEAMFSEDRRRLACLLGTGQTSEICETAHG